MLRFCLVAFCGLLTCSTLHAEDGFRSLFDGKSLSGWEGNEKMFRVADGAIHAGDSKEKIPHNEFLCSKEEFGDFELRLQAKLVPASANAGIQFRSQRIKDHHEVIGYQCDMGEMRDRSIWGSLYDESRRRTFLAHGEDVEISKVFHKEDWNDIVIRCEGGKVQLWVNGYQTVDYTETDDKIARTGRLALQIHGGPAAVASYRKIRIRELD